MDQPSSQLPASVPERIRYFFELYTRLQNELAVMEKEGFVLVRELRAAIDQEKMKRVLQFIHKNN